MAVSINPNKWYDVTVSTPKKLEKECVLFVTKKWNYSGFTVPRKGYTVLFHERFPGRSRDYSDDGIYLEVIGVGDVPLAVAEWNWKHCSCYQWDDSLKLPTTVYSFKSYVNLRKNELFSYDETGTSHYTATVPIDQPMDKNTEDHLYAFRKVIESIAKKQRKVGPRKDSD